MFFVRPFAFPHEVDQKVCDEALYDWKNITLSRIDHSQNYELHKNVQCLQLVFVRMKLIKNELYGLILLQYHVITYSLLNVFEQTFSILMKSSLGISDLFLFNLMFIQRFIITIRIGKFLELNFHVFSVLGMIFVVRLKTSHIDALFHCYYPEQLLLWGCSHMGRIDKTRWMKWYLNVRYRDTNIEFIALPLCCSWWEG